MTQAYANKVQYGKETTHGTAVAATKMLPTVLQPIKPDSSPTFPREHSGIKADSVRSYITGKLVRDTLKFDVGYFQLLPMLFSCGLKGGITPVEQTTDQDDYLWDFDPDMTAGSDNTPNSITLERGDDTYMVKTEYTMFDTYKIKGDINQDGSDSTVKIEASYFGRQNTVASFTALTPQAVLTPINSKLARLYLDTTWAGVGTTEVANTLRGFEIQIMTGKTPKFSGAASQVFTAHGEGTIAIMGAFTFEGNSAMTAIAAARAAQTLQVARLSIPGPQIGTGDPYLLKIDLSGAWSDLLPIASESNGSNLWTAMLKGSYDLTGAKLLQIQTVVNQAVL